MVNVLCSRRPGSSSLWQEYLTEMINLGHTRPDGCVSVLAIAVVPCSKQQHTARSFNIISSLCAQRVAFLVGLKRHDPSRTCARPPGARP